MNTTSTPVIYIHCYSDVSPECQLIFTLCTSSKLVVLRACKTVTITGPQIYIFPFL